MTDDDLAQSRRVAATTKLRVKTAATSLGPVVVKKQRPRRGAWRERFVDLLARLVGLPMLGAVRARGGSEGQAVEVARLRALHAAGVRVPRVLHVEPSFFVMEKIDGPSLAEMIERSERSGHDSAAARDAWRAALAMLCGVHSRGQALSNAFSRNVIVAADGLAMIDFEDDPLEAMTLDEAQARDWLLLLHSTVWHFPRALDAELRDDVAAALAGERPAVRMLVEQAARRLALLRHLPSSRRVWGREVVGARALARLLHLGVAAPRARS